MKDLLPRLSRGLSVLLFSLSALLLPALPLSAQDLYVGSNTSGNSANLTSGTNSYANTFVGFTSSASNNTLTVQNTGTLLSNSDTIYVGYDGAGNSLLITNGGSVTVANNIWGGYDAGASSNSITVSGASSSLTVSNSIYLGSDVNSGNQLLINQGGTVTVGSILVLGYYADHADSNKLIVTGPGTQLTVGNQIEIGETVDTGNQMLISNGATVTSLDSWVGANGGAGSSNNMAVITGTNSSWTISGGLNVGDGSWNNSVIVSNGATLITQNASIGLNRVADSDGGSNNSVLITDGASWINTNASGILSVGGDAAGTSVGGGTLTLTRGGSLLTTSLFIATQTNSSGMVNIGGLGGSDVAGNLNASVIAFGAGSATLNFNQSGSTTLTAQLSSLSPGNGAISQLGSGTTILAGNNYGFTGGFTIAQGGLQIGNGGTNGALGSLFSGSIVNNGSLLFNLANKLTVNAAIAGTGTLAQNGSGTTTLTGSNSYTGGTLISNGTLQVGNGGTNGTFGSGAVTDNAALVFNRSDTLAITNAMSGTGSLAQNGTGITILTGSNSYAGGTVINDGTLQIGDGGTNGTLGSGNVTIGQGFFVSLTIDRADNLTLTNTISGPGSFTKIGAGTLSLTASNSYAGYTTIDQGALILNGGSLVSPSNNLGIIVGYTNAQTTLILSNGNTTTVPWLDVGELPSSGSNTVIVSGSTLNLTNYFALGMTNNSGNALIITNAGIINSGYGSVGQNTSSSNQAVIAGNGSVWNVATANGFYVGDNSDHNSLILSNGGALNTVGTATIGGNFITGHTPGSNNSVLVSDGGSWNSGPGGTIAVGNSGGGALTVTRGGVVTSPTISIAVASNSVGALNIGAYGVNDSAGVLNVSAIQFGSGSGTINLNQSNTFSMTSSISGAGSLYQRGLGTTLLAASNSYTGITEALNGVLILGDSNALSGSTFDASGSGSLSFGALSTATFGNLQGSNNLLLANTNGDAVALSFGGNNQSTVYSGNLSGTGSSLSKVGDGTLTFLGTNMYTGGTLISGGSLAGDSSSLQGDIANNANLTFTQNTNGTYKGAVTGITGSGSVTVSGTATLTLDGDTNGNNSYSGGTTLVSGGLLLQNSGSAGSGAVTVSGGTLDLNNNEITNSISISGGVIGDGTISNDGGTNSAQGGTINAVLSGTSGLAVSGSGTVTLGAANTFIGSTFVSSGTLYLGSGGSLASTNITVAPAGTLKTSGSYAIQTNQIFAISGTVDVSSGTLTNLGTFGNANALTNALLTISNGNLTLGSSSTNILNLRNPGTRGIDYDAVAVSGTLTYGGMLNIGLNSPVAGTFDLFTAGTYTSYLTNDFSAVSLFGSWNAGQFIEGADGDWTYSDPSGDWKLTFSDANGQLVIASVPEPSTWALLGVSLVLGLVIRRKTA